VHCDGNLFDRDTIDHAMVGMVIISQALEAPFPWTIVKFSVDLWEDRLILPIAPIM
jgi:hypothetical protein